MTVIKIHNTEWFMKHCKIISERHNFIELVPIYPCWDLHAADCVSWLSGDNDMGHMEGKVLKVEHDIGINQGDMTGARYYINGFWIPNWAIEWVKEVSE